MRRFRANRKAARGTDACSVGVSSVGGATGALPLRRLGDLLLGRSRSLLRLVLGLARALAARRCVSNDETQHLDADAFEALTAALPIARPQLQGLQQEVLKRPLIARVPDHSLASAKLLAVVAAGHRVRRPQVLVQLRNGQDGEARVGAELGHNPSLLRVRRPPLLLRGQKGDQGLGQALSHFLQGGALGVLRPCTHFRQVGDVLRDVASAPKQPLQDGGEAGQVAQRQHGTAVVAAIAVPLHVIGLGLEREPLPDAGGEAEVDEVHGLKVPLGVQLHRHVVALEVAVDEARPVQFLKALRHAQGQGQDVLEREAASTQVLMQAVLSTEGHEESITLWAEGQGHRGSAGSGDALQELQLTPQGAVGDVARHLQCARLSFIANSIDVAVGSEAQELRALQHGMHTLWAEIFQRG
ncbi:hypothetical protein C7M84_011754 [Penaeus vannamei]|uniref:Uncharacterized protein n=1 Tax=Penaeus vannamei TaxID=6689 RepID=A0A423T145_PENVA|nr:hypothetical protein C7M84_011754 [Penaeus vannamei]